MKILISFIFLAMVLSAITISTLLTTTRSLDDEHPLEPHHDQKLVTRSRFLAENKDKDKDKNKDEGKEKSSPRRNSGTCKKDNEICSNYSFEGRNATCCLNKCVDLGYDSKNCGACKNKCLVTETCCRGQCVNLAFDKRHCGVCNNRCMPGGYCIYGMCDYA